MLAHLHQSRLGWCFSHRWVSCASPTTGWSFEARPTPTPGLRSPERSTCCRSSSITPSFVATDRRSSYGKPNTSQSLPRYCAGASSVSWYMISGRSAPARRRRRSAPLRYQLAGRAGVIPKDFSLLSPKIAVSRANNKENSFKPAPKMLLEAVENLPVVGSRRKNHPTKPHFITKPIDHLGRSTCTLYVCCERQSGGMLRGAIPWSVKYVAGDPGQIWKNVAQPWRHWNPYLWAGLVCFYHFPQRGLWAGCVFVIFELAKCVFLFIQQRGLWAGCVFVSYPAERSLSWLCVFVSYPAERYLSWLCVFVSFLTERFVHLTKGVSAQRCY